MYVYSPPPTNLSPTAEKAKEILKEVKEAQETFKKQRETIKLEAEVCMYTLQLCACSCVLYSEFLSLEKPFCEFHVPPVIHCTITYMYIKFDQDLESVLKHNVILLLVPALYY